MREVWGIKFLFCGLTALLVLSTLSMVVNVKSQEVTEVKVKLPVYFIIFGRPFTFWEFLALMTAFFILVFLIGVLLIEYRLWRIRRALRS
ncbi:MAG: hypothetical protein DRN15_06735 [Thermoprotei archaeon]|nr:MAG: hypothetical protein DRN15_06735 [Thermoprotei archaeon]RLF25562.1 MAG: hypothetical protein DRM97_01390 [Thermoprotei archaeon]